ncbi:hypothetical protein B0T19DRAFT_434995 [Cercophora scortea]|uniref:Extracellular membrane protein CFEM domain-containing protein n=1 Tax=Cercophora scortea TaxID=314031 RepID=A0AAE0M4C9_9PEZI|nr:hypothetical protein B0T19DRAFT_434995 [Cercophora scortea]
MRCQFVTAAVMVVSLASTPLACSTDPPSGTLYNAYPDCAVSCLACKDADYTNNFANNCDFATGDCCQSKHHTVIAATWACVQLGCGAKLAQDAFNSFVDFCANLSTPLAAADIPQGYDDTTASDKSSNDTTQQQQQPSGLSTSDKIGIISGTVGGFISVVGVWFAWKMYQKKKKKAGGGNNSNGNTQLERMHGGPNQRPWEVGIPPSVLENKNIIFTRTTFSFSNIAHITTERWEAREGDQQQAPRRPRALLTRAPRGRIYALEEGPEPE